MNITTRALTKAIKHPELKNALFVFNQNLFNRKQESQIRDQILFIINNGKNLRALSEYPKSGNASADLSILEGDSIKGIVEFKFHYPGDLHLKNDITMMVKDLRKRHAVSKDESIPTTHFVLIVQDREYRPVKNSELKFMGRNKVLYKNAKTEFLNNAFSNEGFECNGLCISHEVHGPVNATYHFEIYEKVRSKTFSGSQA